MKLTLHCAALGIRAEWTLTKQQAEAIRAWIAVGTLSDRDVKSFAQSATARRMLWLWLGLGAVAVEANPGLRKGRAEVRSR